MTDEHCVIIQHFLGEIYYTEIEDYQLFKAISFSAPSCVN